MPETSPKAVIVGVRLPSDTDEEFEASLVELERLVSTLGYRPIGRIVQSRQSLAPAAVLGEGKLEELAQLTGGSGHTAPASPRKKPNKAAQRRAREAEAGTKRERPEKSHAAEPESSPDAGGGKVELVAVDCEISPSQARNLERAAGAPVLDRAGVIIEIFHRHAQSREARLQVEIARLAYTAPRLREAPSGKERRAGRGSGEAALELDRRRVRDRIAELRSSLEAIQKEQGVRRTQRRAARRVALVGYTNAGKSSLMRALTASAVEVEDKLFKTLDTTVRALEPEAKPRILVSDTVGFIKKLPHDLVASFKSTLDEALEASLLLIVVDAADPSFRDQYRVTREVLAEIGAETVAFQVVMNKVDRLSPEACAELRAELPDAWFVSARDPLDVARVRQGIVAFFEAKYIARELVVPYGKQALVAELHENGRVDEERYEEDGVHVRVRSDAETLDRLQKKLS